MKIEKGMKAKEVLEMLEENFARWTKTGWRTTADGVWAWKNGYDFRTAYPYLIVRKNGRPWLKAWPNGGNTYCKKDQFLEKEAMEYLV